MGTWVATIWSPTWNGVGGWDVTRGNVWPVLTGFRGRDLLPAPYRIQAA